MTKVVAVLSSHTPSLCWFRMEMMDEFVARGWKVYAIANEEETNWQKEFRAHQVEYRQVAVQRNGLNPWHDLKTYFTLKRLLREIRPDKIFCFQAKTVIYGCLAANALGIREVYPLIAGLGSVFLSNTLKAKIVRKILVAEYSRALRNCPAVFFQNPDDEEVFRTNQIIENQKTMRLPGSGVNLQKFCPEELPEQPAFLCISRLIRDKGVWEYLEACRILKRECPVVRCMLVGPFDTNPSALQPGDIQPYIDDGSIEFFGEQADVRPFLKQCSVYVLPSYREGTPKTVLEAMATGRAVITTDAPGCRETVQDARNGLLVPVKDVNALVEKMKFFVQHPDAIAQMGHCGREIAEKRFDVKLVNQEICRMMGIG